MWGAVLGGLFLAYKVVSGVVTVAGAGAKALTSTGEAIGSGLYDMFHKDPVGDATYYIVQFPDGQRHQVPSRSVDSSGLFKNSGDGYVYQGDGRTYRLVVERATGNKVAVPA